MKTNCQSCGDLLPSLSRTEKISVCTSCETLHFVHDKIVKSAGQAGPMIDVPSLFQVGETRLVNGRETKVLGCMRFEYSAGFWDEFWVIVPDFGHQWISQDEGDLSFERAVRGQNLQRFSTPGLSELKVGEPHPKAKKWIVTEKGRATCIAMRGSVPERTRVGDKHTYVHLSQPGANLITLEQSDGHGVEAYRGRWIDPFLVQAADA